MSPSPPAAAAALLDDEALMDARLPEDAALAKMSLNALLQTESFEQVRQKAGHLSRLAYRFPGYAGILANPVDDGELGGMLRLSVNIVTSLDRIVSLRSQLHDEAQPRPPTPHAADMEHRQRTKRQKKMPLHTCHNCETADTPRWRAGPHGPRSLCNVCGLVNAKREKRHMLKCATRQLHA